jgi:hypothetical protein
MHDACRCGSAVERNMPAYLVVEHTITEPAKFEEYRTKVTGQQPANAAELAVWETANSYLIPFVAHVDALYPSL